ncbi:MAG: 1,4-alpha-glucan branching protein domain-containing protein [Planctomycetota bacterium]
MTDSKDKNQAAESLSAETMPQADPSGIPPTEHDRPSVEDSAEYTKSNDGTDLTILTETPFTADNYNETYIYLIPKDYESIYVFWEISEAARLHLTSKFGNDFFEKNNLILKLHQVSSINFDGFNANSTTEIDDDLHWKNNYWLKADSGQDYIAEIGYRAHGTNFFEKIARSNAVFVPRGKVENYENYCLWSDIKVEANDVEVPVPEDDWRFNKFLYWKQGSHNTREEKGCWALVLHQHLPYIRHPEYDVSLEEQWFFEAVISVYTQLINAFHNLERDKIDFRLTLSLTPPLISMMQDLLLQKRAARHIDECISFAAREEGNSYGKPYHDAVKQSLHRFRTAKEIFERYDGDLTRAYKHFQDMGKLEIITCPATHMVLPFFTHQPAAIMAQIITACRQYERTFERKPRGIWLPENAYTPGIDRFLKEADIKWFLVSNKSIAEGDTRCFHDTNRPVITKNGVACFGIDKDTRDQVWSREAGYPGHPNYKEWYRDLGYDADWDYLPEYFKTANVRRNTGLKYYRITEKKCSLHEKDYYNPLWAEETLYDQAAQFVYYRGVQATHVNESTKTKPCVVSAYDAELFGHWWEEGPLWIETLFRRMCCDQDEVRPCTPGEFLSENPTHQQMTPGAGSWGKKDYFATWLDGRDYQPNCWVFRHYYRLVDRMTAAAEKFKKNTDPKIERALNQAAREVFLAVASDWGFLIETGQAVRYSELQIIAHIDRAKELLRQIDTDEINDKYLLTLESADCIFAGSDMDFRAFCS